MNSAHSAITALWNDGVWKGCEDMSGFEKSYSSSKSQSYSGSRWLWDQEPPTPPRAARQSGEAHVSMGNLKGGASSATCDKCDGAHDTAACPYFQKPRDDHRDAWSLYNGAVAAGKGEPKARECVAPRSLPRGSARVSKMPGDGSCLFHSIAYGLGTVGHHEDGHALRQRVAAFLSQNPDVEVAGTSFRSWVDWESRLTVNSYSSRLSGGGFWGGAIEMAACAQIFCVDVAVYEEDYSSGDFHRISDFLCDARPRGAVLVLYTGRNHYDALVAQEIPTPHMQPALAAPVGVTSVAPPAAYTSMPTAPAARTSMPAAPAAHTSMPTAPAAWTSVPRAPAAYTSMPTTSFGSARPSSTFPSTFPTTVGMSAAPTPIGTTYGSAAFGTRLGASTLGASAFPAYGTSLPIATLPAYGATLPAYGATAAYGAATAPTSYLL